MGVGDAAAAAGLAVWTSAQSLNVGYVNDNQRGDDIAATMARLNVLEGSGKLARGRTYISSSSPLAATFGAVAGLSVTAAVSGGLVKVSLMGNLLNAGSGATRTAIVKILCDGAQVGDASPAITVPFLSGSTATALVLIQAHTPSIGTHTWTVQAEASVASAVELFTAFFEVEEYTT